MVLQMPRPFPHPKTGVYWYRERVPADIKSAAKGQIVTLVIAGRIAQHKIGDELKISLATKDAREAKARHAEVVPQFATIWQGFRDAPAPLSFKNMRALAGELYKNQVARHEDNPGAPELWDFAEFLALGVPELINEDPEGALPLLRDLAKVAGIPFDPEKSTMSPELEALLVQKGVAPPKGSSRVELLGHALAAQGAAAARLARNARGDFSDDPVERQFPKFVATVEKPAPKITLTGLLDNWANRLRRPDDRTVASYTRVVKRFVAFIGHDDAEAVTDADIVRWHRELVQAEAVKHGTFVKTYQAALSTIYGYAMSPQGGKKVTANPASGLRLEGPKETINRDRDFTTEEAAKILKAASAALTEAGPRTAEHTRNAMRWVPWIGAYTGARPGEICQLRRQDFVMIDGIKCMALLPDAGTIKTGKFRNVPLHPDLVAQGLWEFVQQQPEGPLFYTRGEVRSARPWETTTATLSEWVRKTVKVTDRGISPNHAWRHWFKSRGADVGVEELYLDAICGHAATSAGRRYIHPKVTALYREISRFPAFDPDQK